MADKYLNRTVEQVNTLLDKLDGDYSKDEIDATVQELRQSISTVEAALENNEIFNAQIVSQDEFDALDTSEPNQMYFIYTLPSAEVETASIQSVSMLNMSTDTAEGSEIQPIDELTVEEETT